MAVAEEDAIEATTRFEAAEEEKSKKIFEDVSKKREQKDKNHGIRERSCISTFDASRHLASTGEESLGYKMLVREKLRSSSRELEELEANFRALMDGVMDLKEAEEKLEKARQKLGKMEEKLNKGWAMQAH
ncbi:hypothetical protein D6D17_04090 [Aureobasidium pullulans]|nr:hypothetical protein D6D17_04090 [Aureobasidium pullulans]